MGIVDVTLHRILTRKITISQYFYWKYFCGIDNPLKPEGIKVLSKTVNALMGVFAHLGARG